MSTRGAIAYALDGADWQGVYTHHDGYPRGLGAGVWRDVREVYRGDVGRFIAERITAHPSGYAHFPDDCYCHGWGDAEPFAVRSDTPHRHIEWVYVVDERAGTFTVYRGTDPPSLLEGGAWAFVATFSIWGAEPDWGWLEREPVEGSGNLHLVVGSW